MQVDDTTALSLIVLSNGVPVPADVLARVSRTLHEITHEIIVVNDCEGAQEQQESRVPPRSVRHIHDCSARGGVGAFLAGVQQARGAHIGLVSTCAEAVVAYIPQLLAACAEADLAVATHAPQRFHVADALVHGLFLRTRVCDDPLGGILGGIFVCRREVVTDASLVATGDHVLLDVLVRGAWTAIAQVPVEECAATARGVRRRARDLAAFTAELRRLALAPARPQRRIRRVGSDAAAGAAERPEPLDAALPDATSIGRRRWQFLLQLTVIALVWRLALVPVGHPWDTVTFYNMFIELGHGHSPYASMRYLSDIAQASGWGSAYEGFAYPPGIMYLYYPLAKLFVWLHPTLTAHYPVEGRLALPTMPLDFYFWLKLPFWLGDLGIAVLLWRMTQSTRSFRNFLLNPYVLLVSACWTFDSLMVFALALGVYWLQRGRVAWSGLALAAGTMMKFVPIFAVPACALFLIQRKRPLHEVAWFVGAFAVGCCVLVGPYLQGLLYVLGFQGERTGGGMHWEMIFVVSQVLPVTVDWHAVNLTVGAFSLAVLAIAMLLTYRYVFVHSMSLNRMVLITLLVYLLATKLVNEQYVLVALPFSFIELHAWRGRRPAWRYYNALLWIAPLTFAIMNVPIDRFLLPFYHTVFGARAGLVTASGATGVQSLLLPWNREPLRWYTLDVLALGFMALVAAALVWLVRHPEPASPTSRAASREPAVATTKSPVLSARTRVRLEVAGASRSSAPAALPASTAGGAPQIRPALPEVRGSAYRAPPLASPEVEV